MSCSGLCCAANANSHQRLAYNEDIIPDKKLLGLLLLHPEWCGNAVWTYGETCLRKSDRRLKRDPRMMRVMQNIHKSKMYVSVWNKALINNSGGGIQYNNTANALSEQNGLFCASPGSIKCVATVLDYFML